MLSFATGWQAASSARKHTPTISFFISFSSGMGLSA
jgi:hypothetical protein